MKVRMNPYLVMEGNAAEAIRFYEEALQAKVVAKQTFGDMPEDPAHPLPQEAKNRVLHATLRVGETDFMFSDVFPGQKTHPGDRVTICLTSDSKELSQRFFAALSEGGTVQTELQETFFSPAYGMLTDKFGISFQIVTE
ncbi:VOC family protein [Peribacillus sp. SCS-26]|uniref:VOC family protein n=1 Tax=Paraperibacillus marinus TaxID=3115295 RepID=UPI0039067768